MPKIKVIRPTEEIEKELTELEENIQAAAASIKEMKTTRRTLRKELELAQAKEAEEKQAEEIKELTELMKEKGVTVEYLKSLMCSKSRGASRRSSLFSFLFLLFTFLNYQNLPNQLHLRHSHLRPDLQSHCCP